MPDDRQQHGQNSTRQKSELFGPENLRAFEGKSFQPTKKSSLAGVAKEPSEIAPLGFEPRLRRFVIALGTC